MNASGYLKAIAVAAVVLAATSATASAQSSHYTVCRDGTTWLVRNNAICGQHSGVDPKRSELANRFLNWNLPRDVEQARRREFEQRMKNEIHLLHERQKAEREALNERQRYERQTLEAQRKTYEANQKLAHKNDEANRKAVKDNDKAIKKAQKIARKP